MSAISNRKAAVLVALLTAAVTLLGMAVAQGRAHATYTVIECVGPVGAPDATYSEGGTPKIFATNECVGGGRAGWGLGLEANGTTQRGEWAAWSFAAPPSTYFSSVRAIVHQDARFGYGGLYSGESGTQAFGGEWNTPTWSNTRYFQVSLHCFANPCSSPGGAGDLNLNGGYAFLTNFVADVVDTARPAISASGSLLDGDTARGRQQLSVSVADQGGGAHSVIVFVNGAVSQRTGPYCSPDPTTGGYIQLAPCPPSASANITLDTEKDAGWVNGANEVVVCAYDVSGNESDCIARTVTVDNSCPASGGASATKMSAGIDSNGELRARALTRSTDTPVIRGSLVSGSGQPVPGASVCVYETVDLDDGSRELAATATTQANGRFATKLDAGPSRVVDVVYRFNDRVLAENIELDSTVVPTLRVGAKSLMNGEAARFRGRLPGPNADGRAVSLQARAGRKWRTFKQLRTDALGQFKGRYPFTQTTGRVRYTFRVLVKRQSGYPYEPGSSARRKILVRG